MNIIFVIKYIMMKKYFYNDGVQNVGPISLEELKTKKLFKDTLIWAEGWDNWNKASTVIELSEIFKELTPPPINNKADNFKNENVFFSDKNGIFISNSRIVVHNSTYPTSGITAIHLKEVDEINNNGLYLAFLGLLTFFLLKIVGITFILFGLFFHLFKSKKIIYILELQTISGWVEVFKSYNKNYIDEISNAINNSIINK